MNVHSQIGPLTGKISVGNLDPNDNVCLFGRVSIKISV
jgi:hypothetical protein